MFFRKKATPAGPNWQLVEAFRNEEGQPRQRVVASLGNALLPEGELKLIAKAIEGKLGGQRDLFPAGEGGSVLSGAAAYWADRVYRQIVRDGGFRQTHPVGGSGAVPPPGRNRGNPGPLEAVWVDQIDHEHSALLGPLLPAKAAWESLRVSECLRGLGFNGKQVAAAAAAVIGRLAEPSSEYALVRWIPTTALPELLGDQVLGFDHKYFYRVSDKLLESQEAIEAHLRERSQKLFGLARTVILYDLTNTYFEGQAQGNEKAKHGGGSKEKRNDCPLVVLGMVYDGDGFALAHKTFAGNTKDGSTLVEMVDDLRRCGTPATGGGPGHGGGQMGLDEQGHCREAKVLVVVDAGVASAENLALLREAGFSYLVNDTRGKRGRYRDQFNDRAKFRPLAGRAGADKKPPVEVRMLQEPAAGGGGGADTVLLCRSHGRQQKEQAIFSGAEERFLEEARKLDHRLKNRRLAEPEKVQQAIGRLKAQNPRVQRFYDIRLRDEAAPGAGLLFARKGRELQQHCELFGCYVLRTDHPDFTPEELWAVYISLTQAEEGFRALKSDLGLRPNFHQKEHRVDGHIFITVIAFHLWKWIRQKLDFAGDTRDWATVCVLLQTHCYATLTVPCEDGGIHHIRKAGRPEAQQRQLYRIFGVNTSNLPKSRIKYRKGSPYHASIL